LNNDNSLKTMIIISVSITIILEANTNFCMQIKTNFDSLQFASISWAASCLKNSFSPRITWNNSFHRAEWIPCQNWLIPDRQITAWWITFIMQIYLSLWGSSWEIFFHKLSGYNSLTCGLLWTFTDPFLNINTRTVYYNSKYSQSTLTSLMSISLLDEHIILIG